MPRIIPFVVEELPDLQPVFLKRACADYLCGEAGVCWDEQREYLRIHVHVLGWQCGVCVLEKMSRGVSRVEMSRVGVKPRRNEIESKRGKGV